MPNYPVKNTVFITPRFATSGQPTPEQFNWIKQQGFEIIMNLGMPDHENALKDEGSIVTGLHMTYIHLPVPFDSPTPKHVSQYFNFLEILKDRKIWVHCIYNWRVSAFTFHYLDKVAEFKTSTARSMVFNDWEPDEVWQDVLNWSLEKIKNL